MKRKLLAVVMTVVMVASLGLMMTSCGSKKDDPNTLTIWMHNNEESWVKSYQAIADAYMEANPDVKIQFESFPYDEYETKVQTALMSEEGGADVYELWGGWGVDFAPSGALAEMPAEMAEEIRNDAYPATYGALEYDGKLFAMPMEFNIECGGMLVNNNLMKAAGLEVPTTWADVIAAGEKATVKDGDTITQKGFDFVNWDGVMYLYTSMILSQGEQYMNADGTFNFSSDVAKKAWDELAKLVTEKQVTNLSGLDDGSDIEGYQELFAGQATIVPRGPWCIAEGINSFELEYGKDFSYEKMPFYGSKEAFAAETGWAMGVANGISEEKKAMAFDFLDYFFSDEVIMQHNLACGQIPAKKSVAQSAEYLEAFPYAEPLVGILDGGQFIGLFNTDIFKETVNNVFSSYCKDGYDSVDAALADLEKQCNKMVEK